MAAHLPGALVAQGRVLAVNQAIRDLIAIRVADRNDSEREEDRIVGHMMRSLETTCLQSWDDRSAAWWDSIVAGAINEARNRGLNVPYVARLASLLKPDFGGRR
jgi:hypothetical protein